MGCPTFLYHLYTHDFAILSADIILYVYLYQCLYLAADSCTSCMHTCSVYFAYTYMYVNGYIYTCIPSPSLLFPLCSSQIGCMYELPQPIPCRALYSRLGDLPRPHFPPTHSPLWAPHHMALGVQVHQLTLDTMAAYQTCTTCLGLYLHLSVEE